MQEYLTYICDDLLTNTLKVLKSDSIDTADETYKAWKNEGILERLSDVNYKQLCVAAFFTSLDALFAGMGFGLLKARFYIVALSILIITAVMVILGLYTGMRLGYEQKTKAYGIGGILLLISAIDVVLKYLA